MTTRIHFQDYGQDFLYWDVDPIGMVKDSQPFQASVWVGVQIQNMDTLVEGTKVYYYDPKYDECKVINYPVIKIEQLNQEAA